MDGSHAVLRDVPDVRCHRSDGDRRDIRGVAESAEARGGRRRAMEIQTVKPAEQPAKDPKPDDAEFERFEDLARKLLEVSKQELDEKRNAEAPA